MLQNEKARLSFTFILFTCCCYVHLAVAEDELIFVNIVFRHGDRTPVDPYPNDPYKNLSYWSTGWGQLTNIGKRQHFELGQWLRKRYGDFLPEKYSLNDLYVRSTDVDRTLMSAESNLAGLYTPVKTDMWNPDIMWQPIPIHTVPEKADNIVGGKKKCPRYDMELRKLLQDDEFKRYNLQLKTIYNYVSNHSGKNIHDIQELEYLYNTLFIENLYKYPLPQWTKEIFPEKLLPWAQLSFQIYCYTPTLQRLKVGLLLNEIFTRFLNKTQGVLDPDRKMWIYSGHDTTIANLLMALGAFDSHCPPYTATVIMELRRSVDIGYYVSAYYKNDTEPHPISILGCDVNCPLDRLINLLQPILITQSEWDDECQSLTAPYVSTIAAIAVASCGFLLVILLVSLCIGAVCAKQQRSRNHFYQPLSDDIN